MLDIISMEYKFQNTLFRKCFQIGQPPIAPCLPGYSHRDEQFGVALCIIGCFSIYVEITKNMFLFCDTAQALVPREPVTSDGGFWNRLFNPRVRFLRVGW